MEAHLPGLELRDVEDLVDEPQQPPRVAERHVERARDAAIHAAQLVGDALQRTNR